MATNVVASRPHKRLPTGTPTAYAKNALTFTLPLIGNVSPSKMHFVFKCIVPFGFNDQKAWIHFQKYPFLFSQFFLTNVVPPIFKYSHFTAIKFRNEISRKLIKSLPRLKKGQKLIAINILLTLGQLPQLMVIP